MSRRPDAKVQVEAIAAAGRSTRQRSEPCTFWKRTNTTIGVPQPPPRHLTKTVPKMDYLDNLVMIAGLLVMLLTHRDGLHISGF